MPFSTAFSAIDLPISLAAATLPPVFSFNARVDVADQRLAVLVVDHLRVNVVERAVHIQPRALACAGKLGANARVNALANCVSLGLRNHGLSFLSAEAPCVSVRLIPLSMDSEQSICPNSVPCLRYFAPVLPAFFFSFSSE